MFFFCCFYTRLTKNKIELNGLQRITRNACHTVCTERRSRASCPINTTSRLLLKSRGVAGRLKTGPCVRQKANLQRQRRLLFAGALARQDDKRLPKRLLFAERLEGGQDPGPGQPAQHWQKSLSDDFKAFGALHGSTPSDRRTFGVDRLVWTEAARKGEGAPWYTGVLLGAERFMASWHKSEEEASKLREVNRAA